MVSTSSLSNWLTSAYARRVLWQLLAVLVLVVLFGWLARNALTNFEVRRLGTGFDFLFRPANMPIGESLIAYEAGQPIYLAILVGLLNTILVSVVGILLATLVGTLVGIARLSPNPLLAGTARIYVEYLRNVPLLAHLFLIYVCLQGLPPIRGSISVGGVVFLSNRGLVVPAVTLEDAALPMLFAPAVGILSAVALRRWAARMHASTGRRPAVLGCTAGVTLAALVAGWLLTGVTRPRLEGLRLVDGQTLSPELIALLAGLTLYYSAFIAEIVRGGILTVPRGQWEAASALGLSRSQALSLIVLPQALRVIVPPTTSQYLDLAKTSSLAIAIGYPDLVAVINSVITDTGQAIECVAIIMLAFLAINLAISIPMNILNARLRLENR
jgi:general L-amino acid transport system permease protein